MSTQGTGHALPRSLPRSLYGSTPHVHPTNRNGDNDMKNSNNNKRKRIRQMELPADEVKRPAGGDWSAWERRCRRQLDRNARAMGVAR